MGYVTVITDRERRITVTRYAETRQWHNAKTLLAHSAFGSGELKIIKIHKAFKSFI